ncbi:MAG: (2Fe-2S) ferredoxin domain-containing protein [Candidatus Eremiobacteraeota bacterium]|nr:(2Fe-2S) ferredoxin domain-containing protein [Candidatus Eremiobacteraeota bacterium]
MKTITSISDLGKIREKVINDKKNDKICINACRGAGCTVFLAGEVYKVLEQEFKKQDMEKSVRLESTGCHGFREKGLLIIIYPRKIFCQEIKPDDVPGIISKIVENREIIECLLYDSPKTREKITFENDVPFYNRQFMNLLANNGAIDPVNIIDYIAIDSYTALTSYFDRYDFGCFRVESY